LGGSPADHVGEETQEITKWADGSSRGGLEKALSRRRSRSLVLTRLYSSQAKTMSGLSLISTSPEYGYMTKYARTDESWQPWTSPATVEQARSTISAIRNRQEVSVLMLESVLSLTEHPGALYILNNSALIQKCILLLHRQQTQESLPVGTITE
jgi:hypothetical protein